MKVSQRLGVVGRWGLSAVTNRKIFGGFRTPQGARVTERPDETPPVLHGDGVTDDTDAVQWYLDRGLEIRCDGPGYKVDFSRLRIPPGMALARQPACEQASRTSDTEPRRRISE